MHTVQFMMQQLVFKARHHYLHHFPVKGQYDVNWQIFGNLYIET